MCCLLKKGGVLVAFFLPYGVLDDIMSVDKSQLFIKEENIYVLHEAHH